MFGLVIAVVMVCCVLGLVRGFVYLMCWILGWLLWVGFVVVQCEYNFGFSVCVVMISRVGLVAFWI